MTDVAARAARDHGEHSVMYPSPQTPMCKPDTAITPQASGVTQNHSVPDVQTGTRDEKPGRVFTRVSIITGQPGRIDTVNEYLDTHLHPRIGARTGHTGVATYTSTDAGITIIESTWTSATHTHDEPLQDPLAVLCEQAVTLGAGTLTEENYEITAGIARSVPPHGALVELFRFTLGPGSAGHGLTLFNKTTRDRLMTAAGLYNVRLLLNRDTGHGVITAIWRHRHAAQAFWKQAGHPHVQLSYRAGATFTSIEYHNLTHWKPTKHFLPPQAPRDAVKPQRKVSAAIVTPGSTGHSHVEVAKAARNQPIYREACRDVINYVMR